MRLRKFGKLRPNQVEKTFYKNWDITPNKLLLEKHEVKTFQQEKCMCCPTNWQQSYSRIDLRLVYVEPHNTVASSGNYKYVFGSGTRLQVLTSEYYRQDGLYFKSC